MTRAYTTNGLNQYRAAGSTGFTYDANGNLTSDTATAYLYDIENRMVSAPGGVALSYDPLGRLFQVSNTVSGVATQFLYDGDAMVAEYNGSNVLQRRHVHNVGADVPMATYTVTGGTGLGTISQLFADRQGSIVAQLTSGGVQSGLNTYDEYGIPGITNSGRFQYTGQIWLAEIGIYYYKARMYSPTLGRFMQTDPIGYEDQFNLYAYVGNDPVNRIDPTGECERTVAANGDVSYAGLCPTASAAAYVADQLADLDSAATEANRIASQANRPIIVSAGSTDVNGHDFNAGVTQEDRSGAISITIDPTETGVVQGVDTATQSTVNNYPQSIEEVLEHEIAEAVAIIEHPNAPSQQNNQRATNAENLYRVKRENTFRRNGHTGYVENRPARRWRP